MKTIFKLSLALVSLTVGTCSYGADASKSDKKQESTNESQGENSKLAELQRRLNMANQNDIEAVVKEIEAAELTTQIKFGFSARSAAMTCHVAWLEKLAPYLTLQELFGCIHAIRLLDPNKFVPPATENDLVKQKMIENHVKCANILGDLVVAKMEADPKYAEVLKAKAALLKNKS